MKKILSTFVGVIMMMLSSTALAYPAHLNGDLNYILCAGRMGGRGVC